MTRLLVRVMAAMMPLLTVSARSAPPAPPARATSALVERIAAAARWESAAKSVPSIAVALVDRHGLVWAGSWGFADADRTQPARIDDIYRAGPLTALVTGAAAMRLVEQGRLDLDAPVARYLPAFRPRNPFGGTITVRELMTHRSGLVREPPSGHHADADPHGEADAVASLDATTLVAAPGTRTRYSSAGLAVLGEVIARVTGQPYAAAVRELVLAPLGMTASGMALAPARDRLAYAEMASFDGPRRVALAADAGTTAATNLYTDLPDLARFATAMLDRGSHVGSAFLPPATGAAMRRSMAGRGATSRSPGSGLEIGRLDDGRMVGAAGSVGGFTSAIRLLPDQGLGAIVFSTVDAGTSADRLARYALRGLRAEREARPLPSYPSSLPVTGDEARRLSGWFSDGRTSVGVRIYAGQLAIDGPEIAGMIRRAGDRYRIEDAQSDDDRLAFARDGSWLELDGVRYARREQPEPPPPSRDVAALIGDYGWRDDILRLYERDGRPWARIGWVDYRPLRRVAADRYALPDGRGLFRGETLAVERDGAGDIVAVRLGGLRWPRRDFGAEAQAAVRQGINGDISALRTRALAAQPPREPPRPRATDLVSLPTLDPSIRLDIGYASRDNFMGVPLYQSAAAYLQRPAATAVARAAFALRARGYGLLIHDAYRPWFVTKMFWDATPPQDHAFVADPVEGSRHNRGAAVDLTLYQLDSGAPIVSTGRYDEFSDRSYSNYVGGSDHQRWERDLLRGAMEAQGFSVYIQEWWHFDYAAWRDYPIGNASFEELRAGTARR